jgi:hypothetical protein
MLFVEPNNSFDFNIRHPRWYVHVKVYFTLISSTVTTNTYTCDTFDFHSFLS